MEGSAMGKVLHGSATTAQSFQSIMAAFHWLAGDCLRPMRGASFRFCVEQDLWDMSQDWHTKFMVSFADFTNFISVN